MHLVLSPFAQKYQQVISVLWNLKPFVQPFAIDAVIICFERSLGSKNSRISESLVHFS